MAGNTFGQHFRLTTFGESHGAAVGGIIDGCPAGITLDAGFIQLWMDRRKPGQSNLTTPRTEDDRVEFLSGVFEGKTLGSPIGFIIRNKDMNPADYEHLRDTYRPSHADFTFSAKYGIRDHRGGGRASARETASRVAGGAVAMHILKHYGINISSWVSSVGTINAPDDVSTDEAMIYSNNVRCPHPETAALMQALIMETSASGDSLGGIISSRITGIPAGLGEPVFDKLHADLAKAMISINAAKGFESGMGFAASRMKGSEHNDAFKQGPEGIGTATNRSGGIQGGISNGQTIFFRTAFKPVATIMSPQETVNTSGESVVLQNKGRHDPCVVPRAVPIVNAMAALVIADHLLRNRSSQI